MKRSFVQFGIPMLMVAFFGGCSTQATNEPAAAQNPQPAAAAPQRAAAQPASPSTSVSARANETKSIPNDHSVYYEFDSSEIESQGRNVVEANARYLREHPMVKARIEGNADERGSAEYNLALGQRRAEGVMKALKIDGVADDRMDAVSLGKEKPKAQGHDEAAWAQNRRSDILYR